jgi:secondary thiamine-phosphate synthase enzyme
MNFVDYLPTPILAPISLSWGDLDGCDGERPVEALPLALISIPAPAIRNLMRVVTKTIEVRTEREGQVVNVTPRVEEEVASTGVTAGLLTIFLQGSTAALTTMEYERGLLVDFGKMLERVAPKGMEYLHQEAYHDDNGHSHVRSSLLGTSVTVPVVGGRLSLGRWQQLVLIELDVQPRLRPVVLQMMGE